MRAPGRHPGPPPPAPVVGVSPLGVFLQVGLGLHFRINTLLTLLGHFPGLIHALL